MTNLGAIGKSYRNRAAGSEEAAALFLSLLVHFVAIFLFVLPHHQKQLALPMLPEPIRITTLVPDANSHKDRDALAAVTEPQKPKDFVEPPKNQIVTTPEGTAESPLKSRFLSEKDFKTEHEQVHRGEGGEMKSTAGGKTTVPEHTPRSQTKPQITQPSAPSKSSKLKERSPSLRLDEDALGIALARSESEGKEGTSPVPAKEKALDEYKPFGEGRSLFLPRPGTMDYLPGIPDGDITLLNTKADAHAVFVRRVATQVFGSLRKKNWQSIPFSEILKMNRFTTVEATMSKEGKLLSCSVLETSGSAAFDNAVLAAAREGTWDQNPPPSASADDGKIHFVFKSRSWSRGAPQGMPEQRWLLLGTGLL